VTTELNPRAVAETRDVGNPIAEARDAGKRLLRALVVLGEDFAYCALLWVALYAFQELARRLPIEGRWGGIIEDLHSLGSALAVGLLSILLVVDFVRIEVRRR
jgi:hypothetical protein